MANKIVWHATGEKVYETGLDRGVLFPKTALGVYGNGVAWNGLISVSESPEGAEPDARYADNVKYLTLVSREEFGLGIEAFTYPKEFGVCDGTASPVAGVVVSQQSRREFGMSYRSKIGNDVDGEDHAYLLHLVYGALAAPSEKERATINEDPDTITFSWDVTTTPVEVTGLKPTAHIMIDTRTADATKLAALEVILYGVSGSSPVEARLPLPDEVITLMTPG